MVTEGQVILSDWGKGGANDAFESYTQAHATRTHIIEHHTHQQRHLQSHKDIHTPGWQKLCGGTGGPPLKSLDSDESFKPKHTQFCRELRFVAIYALFGDLCAKKVPFWVKNSVSCARSALLHGIYCIFH